MVTARLAPAMWSLASCAWLDHRTDVRLQRELRGLPSWPTEWYWLDQERLEKTESQLPNPNSLNNFPSKIPDFLAPTP